MHIPHYALVRALTRKRIAAQRKVRAPFARRRALRTARRIQTDLRGRVAAKDRNHPCPYCGDLSWTVPLAAKYGERVTHKHNCPHRTDTRCQTHPDFCEEMGQ